MDLKDEQWEIVKPLLPKAAKRAMVVAGPESMTGYPEWHSVDLRTGACWQDLPERYPPYQTCHRRFQEWVKSGVFEKLLRALVKDVKERGRLDLRECFIDGSFVIAKKGAVEWEKPSGATVQSSWQWQMALVFLSPYPLAVLRRMK